MGLPLLADWLGAHAGWLGSGGYLNGIWKSTVPCSFRAPRDKHVAALSVGGRAIGSLIPLRNGPCQPHENPPTVPPCDPLTQAGGPAQGGCHWPAWCSSGGDQHVVAMQGLTGPWGWHNTGMINMQWPQLSCEIREQVSGHKAYAQTKKRGDWLHRTPSLVNLSSLRGSQSALTGTHFSW